MDGVEQLVTNIESGRSEPSAEELPTDGGWVDPAPAQPQSTPSWGTPVDVGGGVHTPPNDVPQPGTPSNPDVDRHGEVWQEAIHTAGRTQTKDGHWRRKRGKQNAPAVIDDPTGVKREACEHAAKQFVGQFVSITIMFAGGPDSPAGKEWTPIKDPFDEREMMVSAWTDYFFEHGIVKVPAWLAVSLAMGTYTLPRLIMPATQERIQKVKEYIKNKGKPQPPTKDKSNATGNNPPGSNANTVGPNSAGPSVWGARVDS